MLYYKNDESGGIGIFKRPPGVGWTLMSQAEIDAYLLVKAKDGKIEALKNSLNSFECVGFIYLTWSFCLSSASTNNIALKSLTPIGMADGYKYFDMSNVQRDFVDSSGFTAFKDAVFTEKDRIMVKYNNYKSEINACAAVADVDAITIDFAA